MSKNVLICTVGGSHEPILTSIRENKPDFVCFICSEKDPVTGNPGSVVQITGKGSVIKQNKSDDKAMLPAIPIQAGLHDTQYQVVAVPADDLDEAFKTIEQHIRKLTRCYSAAQFVADYTGGTKSMSAALVLAAVENEEVGLRLVTGTRSNLEAVASGMERMELVTVESIRVQRAIERYTGGWQYFAYSEAAKGLVGIKPRNSKLRKKVGVLHDLSKAFDDWDRFDHKQAASKICVYRKLVAPAHQHLLASIKNLTTETKCQTPARLWDLWFNALRRAEQGRFDDAVARLYRLLEWTAQWILRIHCNIDTADIQPDKIPDDISMEPNRKGQYQAGLMNAWQIVGHHLPGSDAGQFSKQKLGSLQTQIELRNYSILAHGDKSIGRQDWQEFMAWMKDNFLELLEKETKQAHLLRSIPKQLPRQPWPALEDL